MIHEQTDRSMEPTVRALRQLSPQSQETIMSLTRQLAEREGVTFMSTPAPGFQTPIEGIPLWIAKLRAERYSERTVHMYGYLAGRYLKKDPAPTKLGVQSYLAGRLEKVSPALVSNERKALASLFSFHCAEGLWHENPLDGVKHIGPRWGEMERRCPSIEDVEKVLEVGCLRAQDSLKIRTVIVLLATTGLRLTECMSLKKGFIDLDTKELRILGKGNKRRVVPLLESTSQMLAAYLEERQSDSSFIFPGNTYRTWNILVSF